VRLDLRSKIECDVQHSHSTIFPSRGNRGVTFMASSSSPQLLSTNGKSLSELTVSFPIIDLDPNTVLICAHLTDLVLPRGSRCLRDWRQQARELEQGKKIALECGERFGFHA
jgi:hypothetical protein